ncbi:unnamed protein product [Boreogadus saida]
MVHRGLGPQRTQEAKISSAAAAGSDMLGWARSPEPAHRASATLLCLLEPDSTAGDHHKQMSPELWRGLGRPLGGAAVPWVEQPSPGWSSRPLGGAAVPWVEQPSPGWSSRPLGGAAVPWVEQPSLLTSRSNCSTQPSLLI